MSASLIQINLLFLDLIDLTHFQFELPAHRNTTPADYKLMALQKASISISHTEDLEQICISSLAKTLLLLFGRMDLHKDLRKWLWYILYTIYQGSSTEYRTSKIFQLTKTKYLGEKIL